MVPVGNKPEHLSSVNHTTKTIHHHHRHHHMIPDILSNKKLNPIVTELFIRGRKLSISPVFIKPSYFAYQKILGEILRIILL